MVIKVCRYSDDGFTLWEFHNLVTDLQCQTSAPVIEFPEGFVCIVKLYNILNLVGLFNFHWFAVTFTARSVVTVRNISSCR